jgi:hypothetical protein
MDPPTPADAVIVYEFTAKLADMVWLEFTFVNVKELTAPTDEPSTRTSAIRYPVLAVIEKVWLEPPLTATAPEGDMEPPVPADALIVKVLRAKLATIVWFAVTLENV